MDAMKPPAPREVIEVLLAKGHVMLCVDSRHPEVRVPENHRNRPDLRLILNLGFRNPIRVSEEGVQADLVFGGAPHGCWIPYESLWGAYNPQTMEGMVWPDRIPRDLPGPTKQPDQEREGNPVPRAEHSAEDARGGDAMAPGERRSRFRVIAGGKAQGSKQ